MPDDISADPVEEQSVEAARPEWLPAKFKDEEAFAKSYSELENRLREQGEERNALETQLTDLYGRVQQMEAGAQRASYDPTTDPTLLAYEHAMESGDYRAALAIQAGLMQSIASQQTPAPSQQQESQPDMEAWAFMAEQTAIQQIGPDEWGKYKERVQEEAEAESFDGLTAAQAGKKLARIYRMVKADDVLNNQQTMAEQQAERERELKLAAQTMTGASGRPAAPTKNETEVAAILKAAKEGSYEALING